MFSKKTKNYHKTKLESYLTGAIFCLIFFSSFLMWGNAKAATYYIDYENGLDSNDGTSTTTPWKLCPGMVGFAGSYSHSAGDAFVFKGGVTWPAASLPLTIGYSGVAGNPDVYTSDQTWYDGASWTRPTFDGENQPADYVSIISASDKIHVTLEYIKITGSGLEGADDDNSYGIKFDNRGGNGLTGVTIQYMELIPFSKSNLVLVACGGGATTTGLTVQYNTFYGAMNHIELGCVDNTSTVDGMIIRGNTFSGYTQLSSSGDHPDGIHLHNKSGALRRFSNLEISGNKFYGIWKTLNTGQIFFEDAVSSAKIFNNIFTISNTVGEDHYIFSPGQIAVYGSDNVEIYNNTFCTDTIGGSPNWPLSSIIFSLGLGEYSGTFSVKNNIFSGARRSVIYDPTMEVDIDYNLHSLSFDGSPGSWDANDKTWTQWQTQGNDAHGYSADPKFVTIPNDLSLQANSPAINKGVDLSTSFATDFLGNARPTGVNSWDIGAYEYIGADDIVAPASPTGLSVS